MKQIKTFKANNKELLTPKRIVSYKVKDSDCIIYIDARLQKDFFFDLKSVVDDLVSHDLCALVLKAKGGGMELFRQPYDLILNEHRTKRLATVLIREREDQRILEVLSQEVDGLEQLPKEEMINTYLQSRDSRAVSKDLKRMIELIALQQQNKKYVTEK